MKNKIKRNKILLLFIIETAAISLGTVAFSTWIISWNNSETSFTSSINVDGYKHTTIVCEGDYNVSKINFDGETGGSGITSSGINDKPVSNPTLDADVILPSSYFDKIDVSNKTEEERNNTRIGELQLTLNAINKGTDNNLVTNVSDFNRDSSTTYTYLKLTIDTKALTYGDFKDYKVVSGYKIANIEIGVSIVYGTYFDSESPNNFYKDIISEAKLTYTSGGSRDTYLKTLQTITNELDSFNKALNGKKLNIEIKAIINGINDN